ncbi:MAG: phosphoribosylanthranilate isomerase [Candidatus Marivariicella framensis]|jgi:phosphoribosylanthranilate isomerase|tara:strand:+ start:1621 stop:2238 length:618 start_codon:yes stop_codon:yes gene_type:complete
MKFKICGMSDFDNTKAVSILNPDYMGFVFWKKSSRYVNTQNFKLPKRIKKTGVFVDASLDYIKKNIKKHELQAVQLHGKETPEYCNLINQLGVETIKAFSIQYSFDFKKLKPYEEHCDFYLFDTKGNLPGGNGFSFDWKILKNYPYKKSFFLSGGIGIEHIEEIHKLLKTNLPIYAIDVNSKFESIPGIKKIDKLTQFKKELYEL